MLAVTAVALLLIVRRWNADFAPLVRLGVTVLFGTAALTSLTPLLSYLRTLTGDTGLGTYADVLWKALGIALLTEIASSICRECGETGAASGVEVIGKAQILLLSLPLINEILSVARDLLSIGGAE